MNGITDQKRLFKHPPKCSDNTPSGLRSWYHSLVAHCLNSGYFLLPYFLYRENHGGSHGFTAGNNLDDDLTGRLSPKLREWSSDISRLLLTPGMLPPYSREAKLAQLNSNDGYTTLKNIILIHHPIFKRAKTILVKTHPHQNNAYLVTYYNKYIDLLQLRAFIKNDGSTLNDPDEFYVFLSGTTHHQYFDHMSCEDRKNTSLAYKFEGGQIVATLEQCLLEPQSPTLTNNTMPLQSFPATPRQFPLHRNPPRRQHTSLPTPVPSRTPRTHNINLIT